MQSAYVDNLAERKATYSRFWAGENLGRPLVSIYAMRDQPRPHSPSPAIPAQPESMWLDPDFVIPNRLAHLARTSFLGDSIPHVSVELGPGALAAYLGSRIRCDYTTVWYGEIMSSITDQLPGIDESNQWWQRHFAVISKAAEVASEQGFYVAIPDLIEGLDILASLRGNQALVLDMMDAANSRHVHNHLRDITAWYLHYYDRIHAAVSDEDGWSICTYLEPFGQGRSCKIQCDFAALLDPVLFAEFAVPFIEAQAANYDYVSYHLDGPGAIYSAPLVATIDKVRVIQWIPGAGSAPEYDEQWESPVIDPLIAAGKVVQLIFAPRYPATADQHQAQLERIVSGLTRLVNKYGPDNFWFVFKYGFSESLVDEVLLPAAREWGYPSNDRLA
jgi:5-methyltetrahydrofolate--homocysteine methyltransferase|tara:strand:- start:5219 stop:6385 length:1167 start_codon:yes stop_codon:yes gene_type:complete